jgi:hypothetical protein
MKKTLMLLAASTALTAALGLPAFSALSPSPEDVARPAVLRGDDGAAPLILASDDEDDDDDHGRGHDDDDDDDGDDCDDDDDDDDDGGCGNAARNPAPAGTVAPPQNGLFGNGAPPQVQVN